MFSGQGVRSGWGRLKACPPVPRGTRRTPRGSKVYRAQAQLYGPRGLRAGHGGQPAPAPFRALLIAVSIIDAAYDLHACGTEGESEGDFRLRMANSCWNAEIAR